MLGGDDLDEALAAAVQSRVWREHRIELDKDAVRWQRVLYQSELVKQALSGAERVPLRIRDLCQTGPLRDLDLTVVRSQMETQWKPLVDRSLQLTVQTMVQSGLRPSDINYVVMIGGTTYVPLVQRMLANVLERQGMHIDDPQTAVAAGAAVLGARVLRMAA
jgi:molecular chaperone DnaK